MRSRIASTIFLSRSRVPFSTESLKIPCVQMIDCSSPLTKKVGRPEPDHRLGEDLQEHAVELEGAFAGAGLGGQNREAGGPELTGQQIGEPLRGLALARRDRRLVAVAALLHAAAALD